MANELAEFNGDGEGHGGALDLRGSPQALEAITRAEIDVSIATAKRYPRSPQKFLAEARSMVSISPELAAQCRYRLPARRGGGQAIEGPSVRLAEICAVCWGNMQIVGRIVDDDGRTVTAQGIARDLERNVAYSVEVRRGIVTRKGDRYSEDMVRTTCMAAISIATRNATFKAIPRAFVALVEEEAERVARGDARTLPERTSKALAYFASKGVTESDVYRVLGVVGPADMTLDHLVVLQGYRTAVQDGSSSVEEIFGPPGTRSPAPSVPPVSEVSPPRGDVVVPGQPPSPNGLDERPYVAVVSEAAAFIGQQARDSTSEQFGGELPDGIEHSPQPFDIHKHILNALIQSGRSQEERPSTRQAAVKLLGRLYGQHRDFMREQINTYEREHGARLNLSIELEAGRRNRAAVPPPEDESQDTEGEFAGLRGGGAAAGAEAREPGQDG